MAAEINLYERYVAEPEDRTHDLPNTSRTAHPTDLAGSAVKSLKLYIYIINSLCFNAIRTMLSMWFHELKKLQNLKTVRDQRL